MGDDGWGREPFLMTPGPLPSLHPLLVLSTHHRAHFEEFHRHSPFRAMRDLASPDGGGDGSQREVSPDVDVDVPVDNDGCGEVVSVEESCRPSHSRHLSQRSPAPGSPGFPVKAFAQMCLGQPSSSLRLESHVVETLVLGSGLGLGNADVDVDAPSSVGGGDLVALSGANRDALEAICEFHGTQGWSSVDRRGLVGSEKAESPAPWQEVVWDWYDARF